MAEIHLMIWASICITLILTAALICALLMVPELLCNVAANLLTQCYYLY